MPRLHVVWDPIDRLTISAEHLPKEIKFAVLACNGHIEKEEIILITAELATMLLEQL